MSKMKQRNLCAAAVAMLSSTGASALELNAGDYKFTVNGNINVHYIYSDCDNQASTVAGGLACASNPEQSRAASSVSNGLLPAALSFGIITQQAGFDIEGHFGLFPGISTVDGGSPNLEASNVALGTAALDVRQVYMTFGNKDIGTFTMGRNFGLFGFDAIINDISIPGVGVAGGASSGAPANTTLGSIGLGYVYTDTLAQINYTSPTFAGLAATVGIYDPLNQVGGTSGRKSQPGFHGKLTYKLAFDANTKLYLSSTFITQQVRDDANLGANDHRAYGTDIGGKLNAGNLELSGWYYYGKGLGTTALFLLGSDGAGNRRGSNGYLAQASYKIDALKLGVNYGTSRLGLAEGETNAGLVRSNSKITGGAYYSLTKNLLLLGEVSSVTAKGHQTGKDESLNFNIGTFLSF